MYVRNLEFKMVSEADSQIHLNLVVQCPLLVVGTMFKIFLITACDSDNKAVNKAQSLL